jgi:diguanylate cyclase (GGDEF)-like protein
LHFILRPPAAKPCLSPPQTIGESATEAAVFEPGTIDLKLTISIGIETCPEAPSIHDLIDVADQALYAAKRQGRNQVVLADDKHKENRREQVQLKESS